MTRRVVTFHPPCVRGSVFLAAAWKSYVIVLIHTFCRVSGDGCGHTVLGGESGTLASQNYPGTYPSNTWCRWRLRVPEGRTLRLLFGDFDVESSPGCRNGSIVITDKTGESSLGESLHCACKSQ